jgi:carbamoyltransferase
MKKPVYILGVNTTYHELSACLIKNGRLIAAVEEERFSRIKHGKPALFNNPNVVPFASIDFCLNRGNITFADVTFIALSFYPKDRLKNIGIDKYFKKGDWGSEKGEKLFYSKHMQVPKILSRYAKIDLTNRIIWIPHHISHAGSAYYVSPFTNSAILAIDGIGEISSAWLGNGKDNKMQLIKTIDYPNSVGFLWENLSEFLGFAEHDASKVMGLASYGDWKKYYAQVKKIFFSKPEGEFVTNNDILQFRLDQFTELEKLFKVKRIKSPKEITKNHKDIAASLQKVTNEVVVHLGKYLARITKSKNLCLAGGVALNCVANFELMKTGYFRNIYIQPAANDAGTALGAAYYIWHEKLSRKKKFIMNHSYWGTDYNNKQIEQALIAEKVKYERIKNIESKTASLLSNGNIIGWFQGRMEWGPRALGNRSLLADPRDPKMKNKLNIRIKKREPFRPFAPSVLKNAAKKWFEFPKKCFSLSTDFMEFTIPVKKEKRSIIPAVTHVDGTSRIQTVDKKTNPKYYKLISEFNRITRVPMILNTSFNENEPIVCSPTDAIKTFKKTHMDYLVINNFLVSR